MDTSKLPIGIKTYMALMRKMFKADVYLSGGSLCEHKTNDFDIVVLSNSDSGSIIESMRSLYNVRVFDEINCYAAYEDDDDKFHTKIVCEVNEVKVDFLFAFKSKYTIQHIMDLYPLSIQMHSVDLDGNYIRGSKYRDDVIVVYHKGIAEEKYKDYYPDKEFKYDCT